MVLAELCAEARALSAFRILTNGEGRAYSVAEAASGRHAIELVLRRARAFGYVTEPTDGCYAMLDVLDADGSIVQDYGIPHAQAFRWWKRQLHLRVEPSAG